MSEIALVKPARLPSRRHVVGIIAKHIELLDEGAHVVDASVGVPHAKAIDVLARGSHGEWLVVDVFDGADPAWVASLLHHLKWVDDNQTYLATMLGEHDLHGDVPVRAVAVVAKFTDVACSALSFLENVPLECYVARCFSTVTDEQFIALERPVESSLRARVTRVPRVESQSPRHLVPVELTEDEVNDFLVEKSTPDKKSASSFI